MSDSEQPEIAIIDSNALTCIGLASILQSMMPSAIIRTFNTFIAFTDDTPDTYFHYFISRQIFIENSAFFLSRIKKTIILTNGIALPKQWNNIHTLNICQEEKTLLNDIMSMFKHAHNNGQHLPNKITDQQHINQILSPREIEVVSLVVKGFINKEIANKLNISLTTVISHRKNITEKLGIKTVSGLTVFAITNGIIEANEC